MRRRRSWAEGAQLVAEFEQSGLRRKEFCAVRGLNVFTLDAWRRRIAQSRIPEKIVPVEIVEGRKSVPSPVKIGSAAAGGQFRIVLAGGLRVEIAAGFDAAELRRLLAALAPAEFRTGLSHRV